jgi:uncharacterized protein YecE (DUF72 family)
MYSLYMFSVYNDLELLFLTHLTSLVPSCTPYLYQLPGIFCFSEGVIENYSRFLVHVPRCNVAIFFTHLSVYCANQDRSNWRYKLEKNQVVFADALYM